MSSDWPQEAIASDLRTVMGRESKDERDRRFPLDRVGECTTLFAFFSRKLGTTVKSTDSKAAELFEGILRGAIAQYEVDFEDKATRRELLAQIKAAQEIIGLTDLSEERVQEILKNDRAVVDLSSTSRAEGYRSKQVRLYLAGRHVQRGLKTVSNSQDYYSKNLAEVLRHFFDKHLHSAKLVAVDLGLLPSSFSPILEGKQTDHSQAPTYPLESQAEEENSEIEQGPGAGSQAIEGPDADEQTNAPREESANTEPTPQTDQLISTDPRRGSTIRLRAAVVAIVSVALVTAAIAIVVFRHLPSFNGTSGSESSAPPLEASPEPAPSPSLWPVQVVGVTEITSQDLASGFAVPEKLEMTDTELAEFNSSIASNSEDFSAWYEEKDAAPVDFGFVNITLRGNTEETIHITGMEVVKECDQAFAGAFFQPFTQGEEDTIGIVFDLDELNPIPQSTAIEARRGTGQNYFASRTITLEPEEDETLSIGAYTEQYSCEFRVRLLLDTSSGSYIQDIDYYGKPLVVTAMASPVDSEFPYSGYEDFYGVFDHSGQWEQMNPSTYNSP